MINIVACQLTQTILDSKDRVALQILCVNNRQQYAMIILNAASEVKSSRVLVKIICNIIINKNNLFKEDFKSKEIHKLVKF